MSNDLTAVLGNTIPVAWANDISAAIWGAIGTGRNGTPPTTASDVRTNLGFPASSGSSLIGFLQAGTGATARTVQAKLRDFVNVKDFGATGDGVTDDTTAIVNANAAAAALGGGTVWFPPGTYMVSTIPLSTNGILWQGSGQFVTTLKGNTNATTSLITITDCARRVFRDMNFDGNSKCANTIKFVANLGSSCGVHHFYNCYFTGATTDTLNLSDAGGGSSNDMAHLGFYECFARSTCSNSQIKISAANAVDNNWFGGEIGDPNETTPFNVDLVIGQFVLWGTFFTGSATYDVQAASGQIQWYGCRSESVGGIFHSLNTDTGGQAQAPHIIMGVQASTAAGVGNDIFHEAQRALILGGNFFNKSILVGKSGGAGLPDCTCYLTGVNAFAAGKDISTQGNGLVYQGAMTNNSIQIGDAKFRDVQFRHATSSVGELVFSSLDATPSVSGGDFFRTANAGATTITDFDDGYSTQIITVRINDANTTIQDNANIVLAGGANFTGTLDDIIRFYTPDGATWYEVSRSVN